MYIVTTVNEPKKCIFCGSDDISALFPEQEGWNIIVREVDCNSCTRTWHELFKFQEIQVENEDWKDVRLANIEILEFHDVQYLKEF